MTTARGLRPVFCVLLLLSGAARAAAPDPYNGVNVEAVKRLCPITEVADYRAVSVAGSRAEVCAALWVAVVGQRPWVDSASYRTAVEVIDKQRK